MYNDNKTDKSPLSNEKKEKHISFDDDTTDSNGTSKPDGKVVKTQEPSEQTPIKENNHGGQQIEKYISFDDDTIDMNGTAKPDGDVVETQEKSKKTPIKQNKPGGQKPEKK